MKTSTWATPLTAALFLSLSLPMSACGDDSSETSGSGGGSTKNCGTVDDPDLFTIADVTPAPGATVDSLAVVHSFRIVDAPGIVQQLGFQSTPSHNAGLPTPAELSFTVKQEGADLVYTAASVTWAEAGHVELSVPARYDVAGCAYAFPSPLFSYDLAPPEGAGGGGTGGEEGTGGAGVGGGGAGGGDE